MYVCMYLCSIQFVVRFGKWTDGWTDGRWHRQDGVEVELGQDKGRNYFGKDGSKRYEWIGIGIDVGLAFEAG